MQHSLQYFLIQMYNFKNCMDTIAQNYLPDKYATLSAIFLNPTSMDNHVELFKQWLQNLKICFIFQM
jgi:hypothetical protein